MAKVQPSFCSMKQLHVGVLLLPLNGMPVHHRVTWFIYYEVTRSIATPPGWDASPSQGNLVYIL